jgi:hypothetical protein
LPLIHDAKRRDREQSFRDLITSTLTHLAKTLSSTGMVVLVVGEASRGSRTLDSALVIRTLFQREPALRDLRLERTIEDTIPDVRRSRRDLRGTKRETVLVFQRKRRLPKSRADRSQASREYV